MNGENVYILLVEGHKMKVSSIIDPHTISLELRFLYRNLHTSIFTDGFFKDSINIFTIKS